ncbi:MAG: tRNA pseudouridine(13) synthase TruD [Pontibacterium sp.]
MTTPFPTDFAYLYGTPSSTASIRNVPEDFKVIENLGFEPEGTGEHVFLYVRKKGENTDWVARQLAKFAGLNPRDAGYAGKKDRHAVTEQWFSLPMTNRTEPNWRLFGGKTIDILKTQRHARKLRTGSLKGNRFELRLRDLTHEDEFAQRIEKVKAQGVPNYFGEQRFGFGFGNLEKGVALLNGTLKERQRNKKTMYVSAVRSWCFNHLVSQRIEQMGALAPMAGDVFMLAESQSCFTEQVLTEETLSRLQRQEIRPTAAMWGRGNLLTEGDARAWETEQLFAWQDVLERMEHIGLKQERRAAILYPQALEAKRESEGQWLLSFELPAGAFATSVLRELVTTTDASQVEGT